MMAALTGEGARDQVLNVAQAATLLGRRPEQVYYLTYQNSIPHFHVGRGLRFRRGELLAWKARGHLARAQQRTAMPPAPAVAKLPARARPTDWARGQLELSMRDMKAVEIEHGYWEAWRRRQRIAPGGIYQLEDTRKAQLVDDIDTLLRYGALKRRQLSQVLDIAHAVSAQLYEQTLAAIGGNPVDEAGEPGNPNLREYGAPVPRLPE